MLLKLCKMIDAINIHIIFLVLKSSVLQANLFTDSEEPISLEEKDQILCSHCIFNSSLQAQKEDFDVEMMFSSIEVNDINCSHSLPLLSCSYCNYSYECNDGYCKQFQKVCRIKFLFYH